MVDYICQAIEAERKAKGLTKVDLCKAAGISAQAYNKAIKQSGNFSFTTVCSLLTALDLRIMLIPGHLARISPPK